MSRVRRSVPRSSDSTSSFCCSRRHRVEAFAQQLDRSELRGERRAELVRDVREHGIARAAHAFELGLVANDLHLQVVDRRRARDDRRARRAVAAVQPLGRLRVAFDARAQDRAARFARPLAVLEARLQHVAAEAADRFVRLHAEQPRGLRIEIANDARLVDGVHALDDAARARPAPRLRAGAASPVSSTRLSRMSSIVRASLPTSCVPPTGIEVEKSPWPSRSAASRQRARPDR